MRSEWFESSGVPIDEELRALEDISTILLHDIAGSHNCKVAQLKTIQFAVGYGPN